MARRDSCRICGGPRLFRFLDLGLSPLANRFVKPTQLGDPEPKFPLDVFFCEDCSLVQLTEVVDPEILFRDYVYVSGTSDTMRAHFAAYAQAVLDRFKFSAGALVGEIASNDGTFLGNFAGRGLTLLGVEPASNIAEIARGRGIPTVNEFFGQGLGEKLRAEHGPAACVLANNVFAHVDDMVGFAKGVAAWLGPEGIFVFENSYVRDMLDHLEFDSVYHEHLSYFSVSALTVLFERHGMEIFDVQHQPVHGGSLRVFVKKKGGSHAVTEAPARFRAEEKALGLLARPAYEAFARKVYGLKESMLALLRGLRKEGKRVVAYGSSAKGNTLLNFMGIGKDLIEYIVDKNPLKQGTFSPGMHLPVVPATRLGEDRPDYALILAWNFTKEILAQQQDYLGKGGRFIVPTPEPHVIP